MDPTPDGRAEYSRVAEIRREIELAKIRIVQTIDALEHKADVPARLADALSTTASNITGRVLQRIPSPSGTSDTRGGPGEEARFVEPPRDDA